MKLEHQIALITGGASGMGRASYELFKKEGATVVVWDVNPPADLPDDILFVTCDVKSAEDVEKAMHITREKVGVPRICIHCAGIVRGERMVGREGPMSLSAFSEVISVNLIGTFNVMRIVSSTMVSYPEEGEIEDRGVIITTASVAAFEGQIGQMAYSASKGGVVAMTLPAARELASFGIRVNTIAPGLMETPMLLGMNEEVRKRLSEGEVFPKRFGKPNEFALLAKHIVENSFINGETIRLDGAIRLAPK